MSVQTYSCGDMPFRSLGTLPTSAPTDTTFPSAKATAHGVMPSSGYVTLQVSAACDIDFYIFSMASNTWVLGGGTTGRSRISYSGAAMDDFKGPPGALVYFVASAGSKTGYTSAMVASNEYK